MHVPTWGAPAIAAVALGWSMVTTIRTFLRDRRADRRTNPEHVSAWTGPHIDDCEFVKDLRARDEWVAHHAHSVVIRNGSTQPMYDVVLGVAGAAGAIENKSDYLRVDVGLMPPQATESRGLPCWVQHHAQHQVPLDVMFTDGRSVRWKRDTKGRLRKMRQLPDWWARRSGLSRLRRDDELTP